MVLTNNTTGIETTQIKYLLRVKQSFKMINKHQQFNGFKVKKVSQQVMYNNIKIVESCNNNIAKQLLTNGAHFGVGNFVTPLHVHNSCFSARY